MNIILWDEIFQVVVRFASLTEEAEEARGHDYLSRD